MQTKNILLILIILLSFDSFAQQADYEWGWATRGGGPRDLSHTWQNPVHYDQDSIKGMPVGNNNQSPNNKTIYVIKYNANGDFEWLKEPESDNTALPYLGQGDRSTSRGIFVEEDGTIHWLIDLLPWHTYEDGSIAPDSIPMNGRYIGDTGVLKYDKDGNFLDYLKLDLNMIAAGNRFDAFTFDPVSNQYYLAAKQDNSINGGAEIGVDLVTQDFYLAAFNATDGSALWWHEGDDGYIADMDIDGSGNIYLTGTCTPLFNNSFAGYTFTHSGASRAFLIKLNSNGQLQWGTNAETNSPPANAVKYSGDEVIVGLGLAATIVSFGWHWDGLEYIRPSGHGIDPGVIRFDAQTGAAIALHDIVGAGTGSWDIMRSVAVDKLGNIVAGGMMTSPHIFNNHPVVPQLDRMAVSKSDFFIAQLAKAGVSCEDFMSVEEVHKPEIRIFPNPAGNILNWQADIGIIAVSLYDISGRVVKELAVTGQSGSLSLEGLSGGSYIVVLRDGTGRSMHQVLIKE